MQCLNDYIFFFLKLKGNEGSLLWNLFCLPMGDPEG